MTDSVCFEVDDLRNLADGTQINLRYQTHQSRYENEKAVEGSITVVEGAVKVGNMHKVFTEKRLDRHRSVGEVVHKTSSGWNSVGVFYRAEVL